MTTKTTTTLPKVSVIMPAYKQAAFITAALDSVAEQTYQGPIEVLVIDDQSPDDTAAIAAAHPLKPRVITQKNTGVSGARNKGIALATGEWLAFLDSDDAWAPQKLELQLNAALALGQPCLSMTRYRRVDEHGETLPKDAEHPALDLKPSARRMIYANFVGTSTALAHRSCFERCGGFPDNTTLLRSGQDFALWLRIASHYPLVYVPEVLTYYTVHKINRVGIDPLKHYEGGINALKDFASWEPERFTQLAGMPLEGVILWRTLKLLKNVVVLRDQYPEGTLKRALPTVLKQLI